MRCYKFRQYVMYRNAPSVHKMKYKFNLSVYILRTLGRLWIFMMLNENKIFSNRRFVINKLPYNILEFQFSIFQVFMRLIFKIKKMYVCEYSNLGYVMGGAIFFRIR